MHERFHNAALIVQPLPAVFGILIGSVAGYCGGRIDDALMRFTEFFQTIPQLAMAVVIVAIFNPTIYSIVAAISVVSWPPVARLVRGEFLNASALSEPDTGSDLASISCRAVLEGDEWVLTGNKYWCTFADGADYLILFARTSAPPASDHGPQSGEAEPGQRRRRTRRASPTRASRTG